MDFLYCVIYLVISGVAVFLIGRIFPRGMIKENVFPFKAFGFEKDGRFYDKFAIKKWKTKLPDASLVLNKIIPRLMPKKRMGRTDKEKIPLLIKETCVAESTHFYAGVLGFYCIKIWAGVGGVILSVAYCLWNIPFIMIQRYNRPRLTRALLAA